MIGKALCCAVTVMLLKSRSRFLSSNSGRNLISRCVAGILLLNSVAPAVVSLVPVRSQNIVPGVAPTVAGAMMSTEPSESGPSAPIQAEAPSFRTQLNDVGRLTHKTSPQEVRELIKKAEATGLSRTERARAQIRVGEGYLGLFEPAIAEDWFLKASKSAIQDSPEFGIARYDRAISLFRQGRYQEASDSFATAVKGNASGFNYRDAVGFYAMAKSCAGYHLKRAEAGITEPFHLDPLCGVAAMGQILRKLGKEFSEESLVKKIRHTGEGSSFDDLKNAAPKFGLSAHQIKVSNNESLKALFRLNKGIPIVARVEHDHFIAVAGADEKGVDYFCSDCGEWPGGRNHLTWEQWQLMEADAFLAVAPKGSDYQLALAALPKSSQSTIDARWMSPVGAPTGFQGLLGQLVTAGIGYIGPYSTVCGGRLEGLCCPCDRPACMTISRGPAMVNVATGASETGFAGGSSVFNAIGGPSVSYGGIYNSQATTYCELGNGWSTPYNVGVIRDRGLVEPNGSIIGFRHPIGVPSPSASNPGPVECTVGIEHAVKVTWYWDSATGGDRYEIEYKDRSKWVTESSSGPDYSIPGVYASPIPAGADSYRPIQYMVDRFGDRIELVRTAVANPNFPTTQIPVLSQIKDKNGSVLLTLNLDSSGILESTVDAFGRKVKYEVEEIANDLGGINLDFPNGKYLRKVSQPYTGTPSSVPLATEYTYGLFGNGDGQSYPYLQTISQPNPAYYNSTPSGGAMSTWTFEYPAAPAAAVVEAIVDPNGNRTEFTEVSEFRTKVTTKDATNTVIDEFSADFNNNQQVEAIYNADGVKVSEAWYDASGDVSVTTEHYSSTKSITTRYDYQYPRNLVYTYRLESQGFSNPLPGIGTQFKFDETSGAYWGGDLIEVQEGTGAGPYNFTPTRAKTTYTRYANGLVQTVSSPAPGQTGVSATLQTTTYTYDALGNILQIQSPGNNAETVHTTTLNYTTDGTYTTTAKRGQPVVVTNSNGEKTHFRYDVRGNLIQTWDNLGNTTDFAYDPLSDQQTQVQLPATGNTGTGRATTVNTYAWLGGPVNRVESFSEAGGTAFRTVNLSYGKTGELLSRTGSTEDVYVSYDGLYRTKTVRDGFNNAGHTTTYTYNTKGQLTQFSQPSGATGSTADVTQFTIYDLQNNPLSRTDGRGMVTNFVYDEPNGNLSSILYPAAPSEDVTLTYVEYQRPTGWSNGTGSETATYDESDMILSRTTAYTGMTGSKTISYTYYPDGSRQSMSHPGDSLGYSYDKAGRCIGFSTAEGNSSFTYDAAGRMTHRYLPNDIYTNYSYNQLGLLSQVANYAEALKSKYDSLEYDGAFNLKSLYHDIDVVPDMDGSVNFSYDSKDRLTQEVSTRYGGYTESQAYDNAGNPTTFRSATGFQYNNANQRTGTDFTYDGNGNPTKWKGVNATFDKENRMLSFGTQTNGYRADNLRAWRQDASTAPKTFFLYDNGNVVCELDASGAVVARNAFAPDGLVSRVEGSTAYFYMFDQQGNVVNIITDEGQDAIFFAYNAWGSRNFAYPDEEKHGLKQPFSFNGKWGYYLDTETGLYYCQNRFYDPTAGRWLTRDPIGFSGGINVYGYCINRPTTLTDATGLTPAKEVEELELAAIAAEEAGNTALAEELWAAAGKLAGAGLGAASADGDPSNELTTVAQTCQGGIYHLVDKCTGLVRYVGQTNDFVRRNWEHLRDPDKVGLEMKIVMKINDPFERLIREMQEISFQKEAGCDLLNKRMPIGQNNPLYNLIKASLGGT